MAAEYYAVFDTATGLVRWCGQGPDGAHAIQEVPDGMGISLCAADVSSGWLRDATGSFTPPLTYGKTLDDLKAEKWLETLDYRNWKQEGGCMTPLGRVDTDADSQRKISGAALAAMIARSGGQSFSVDWTMADNSVVTHDAAAMIAMGMAVTVFLSACQNVGTTLRSTIDAAETEEAVAAVDITVGYPT